jgi:hypothetical protein
MLATQERVAFEAFATMPVADLVERRLDDYATRQLTAILIFPFVTSEAGLTEVLAALQAGSPRWKLRDRGHTADVVQVGVEWTTAAGDVNDAMGFAPMFSMPVPRRAQDFAIGLWPGGRGNPFRGTPPTPRAKPGRVSFLDAAHALAADAYDEAWTATEHAVRDLMMLPADDASRYRNVAFVLSTAAASSLALDPS